MQIRPVSAGEADGLAAALEIAAGRHPTAAAVHEGHPAVELDRTLAVFDRDRIVGGTASELREITVPGGAVLNAAKITLTGLLPGYRGAGIGSTLMRRQLSDLRARAEPIAVLTAAQSGVPGRHGFGIATMAMAAKWRPSPPKPKPKPKPDLDEGLETRVRLIGDDEARLVLPQLFDAHRRGQPGQVSRSPGFWTSWFLDQPMLRTVEGERFVLVAEHDDGTPGGYLTYRLRSGPLREQPVSELVIEDLITVNDSARRALWGFCCGFDQASWVSAWNLPQDEPLAWIVPEPKTLSVTRLRPFLRLRLIDVATALAARRYAVQASIVLSVTDPVLTDNSGAYLLRGGPDGAECTRLQAPAEISLTTAEISLTVAELAAVYLGGTTFTALARAGRVAAAAADALRRADTMFAWHPAPWTVTDW